MASAVYPKILEAFATKLCDWETDNAFIILLTSAYTYDAADQYVSDLTGEVARSSNLTGKTATLGVLYADNVTFTGLTGSVVTQFVLAFNSGVDGSSRLIAHLVGVGDDATYGYTGLPLTPDSTDVPLIFPADANKIMVL